MPLFRDVFKYFEECGRELQTTESEYNMFEDQFKSKVNFKATCGHDNTVTLTNFYSKKSGLICKKCVYKEVSSRFRAKSKEERDYFAQEHKGFKLLRAAIWEDFDIIDTTFFLNKQCHI